LVSSYQQFVGPKVNFIRNHFRILTFTQKTIFLSAFLLFPFFAKAQSPCNVCGEFTRDSVSYFCKGWNGLDKDAKEVLILSESGAAEVSCYAADFEVAYYYKKGSWKMIGDTLVITYIFSTEINGASPVISRDEVVVKLTWSYDYSKLWMADDPARFFWRGQY
jgi:hypothetical protein